MGHAPEIDAQLLNNSAIAILLASWDFGGNPRRTGHQRFQLNKYFSYLSWTVLQ